MSRLNHDQIQILTHRATGEKWVRIINVDRSRRTTLRLAIKRAGINSSLEFKDEVEGSDWSIRFAAAETSKLFPRSPDSFDVHADQQTFAGYPGKDVNHASNQGTSRMGRQTSLTATAEFTEPARNSVSAQDGVVVLGFQMTMVASIRENNDVHAASFRSRGRDRVIGVGAKLNERFTLEKELGSGGMGTVYRATDQLLGRNVAIKFLKDSGTEKEARQIRLEAQILARLVHDKIVRLYDFGESDGNCFLVMEEVNGPSFAARWRDLLLSDRLRICGQVAEALDYAHFQGVVHRDVKPGNVLLTPGDLAKLSDFGLSLVTGDQRDQSWTIRGTPSYMSPEQAQGRSLDHRTDLYSVGVMVYECATGDVPFVGDKMSVINQHIHAKPTAPRVKNPDISSTLERLILSLLEKHPGRRPASGNVVALALTEEAERARRFERINPGPRRSDPRSPIDLPPSRTLTGGDWKAENTPANGSGRVDPGIIVPSATGDFPSALHRFSDTTGHPPSLAQKSPQFFQNRRHNRFASVRPPRRPRDAHDDTRDADRHLARRALSLRSLPGVSPGRRAAAGAFPQTSARREELGPRTASASDDLAVVRRADPGGDRPRQRTARRPPRCSGRAQPRRGDEIPGQPRYVRQAQAIPPGPQAAPGSQRLCAHDDARRERRAQPRHDAPEFR